MKIGDIVKFESSFTIIYLKILKMREGNSADLIITEVVRGDFKVDETFMNQSLKSFKLVMLHNRNGANK